MKTLKFDHELALAIAAGTKTSTWRIYDDKDIAVNDVVTVIDKVDKNDKSTWLEIGTFRVDQVTEKRLGDIDDTDLQGHEIFSTQGEMLSQYQAYYGDKVSLETPIKIIRFTFSTQQLQTDMEFNDEKTTTKITEVKLYADGGSRGNPGPSASGYVLYDMHDGVLVDEGVYLGITTNNQAEYQALKFGLDQARKMNMRIVHVHMDSLLVINQMKGIFKVKNRDLWPIHEAIKQIALSFEKVTYVHVPRELNKAADAAVNRTLDSHLG